MKNILRAILCSCLLFSIAEAPAQTLTAKPNTDVNPNIGGYYEYLPQGYNTSSDTYPLIVFCHGSGETGNGNGNLSIVLRAGLPLVLANGTFPTSFNVDGEQRGFLVMAPQFKGWPAPGDVGAMIDYAIAHYRVNINRIYLTGLSMGGGGVWDYAGSVSSGTTSSGAAERLAAIVPVAGASYPENTRARVIANANLPVWATHNNGDPTVPYFYSTEYIRLINLAPAPSPMARLTTFNSSSHDAWTATYDPATTIFDGGNIYNWMLTHSRGVGRPLPVKLSSYTILPTNNNTVAVNWTTSFEQNNDHFTIERSADGTTFTAIAEIRATNNNSGSSYSYEDAAPLPGVSYYRLSQTDIDKKVTTFDARKVTLPGAATKIARIYPNPVMGDLNIELQNDVKGKITFTILTSNGRKVKSLQIAKSSTNLKQTIPLSELTAGYYIIEAKGDNFNWSTSFIKK